LLERGERVVIIDDLSTGFRVNVPGGAKFHQGSIADSAFVVQVMTDHEVSDVVHLAGSLDVSESVAEPTKYYSNNITTSVALLDACGRAGVSRLVFSSTAAVYGNPQTTGPIPETATPRPISPYARSKLAVEWLLQDAHAAYRLSSIALRYFNVAGADPLQRTGARHPRAKQLIRVTCQTALGLRPEFEIFGDDYPTRDGTGVRDYVHVADLADAHIASIEALRSGQETCATLNCGYGRGYSVLDVVTAVEAATQRLVPVKRGPRRPGDVAESVADNAAIITRLNWQPRFQALSSMIEHTLQWERALAQ
jgi:UDP-glucose 4-epimerase